MQGTAPGEPCSSATLAGDCCSAEVRRGVPCVTVVIAIASLLALLACSVPAFALSQPGHEYERAFGAPGQGEGQLSNPAGVAVNEVSGDVYVVDRGNNRVERFNAEGDFLEAWGYGVKDGERTYETCAAGEACKAGSPGKGKGRESFTIGTRQFVSPEAIAVDNTRGGPSSGDVYVVADVVPERAYVDKFSANGAFLARITKTAEAEADGRPDGVAVDASGQLWIAWSGGEISHFDNALTNRHVGETGYAVEGEDETLVRPGLAVDARDHLYLSFEPSNAFEEASDEESVFSEEGRGERGEEPCELSPCFAADLVAGAEEGEVPADLGEAFVDGLFGESATGMAANLADNDVYIDHPASVSAYSAAGELIQNFGSGQLKQGRGVAVDAHSNVVYVADAASDRIDVFVPQKAAAPTIEDLSAAGITTAAVKLSAEVNPTGAQTTIGVQYGTAPCSDGGCIEAAATPATLAAGFEAESVSASLAGLVPGTTYHYRVIATGDGTVTSGEATFATLPVALADDRAWEMVSPAYKNGVGIESLTHDGGVIQASESGERLTYVATGPSELDAEGNRSPASTQEFAERITGADGLPEWQSREIATPDPERQPGVGVGKEQEYLFFSPDLSRALVEPFGRFARSEPKLAPEATEKTIYIRNDEGCLLTPGSCQYTPLVTGANDTAEVEVEGVETKTRFGGIEGRSESGIRFQGATPDLTHVVLSSEVPLTTEAASPVGAPLYEWAAGEPLKLVNVLPEGATPALTPVLGEKGLLTREAISADGSRVIWEGATPAQPTQLHLYTREMTAGVTTQVDAPEAEVSLGANEDPVYQGASTDGTRIFFTDEQQLTKTATVGPPGEPSLYEFDATTGKLTDLTPFHGSEPADVLGLLPGLSEDGSTVYFVANGVLGAQPSTEGEMATPGECLQEGAPAPGATCNLYVEQFDAASQTWGQPSFIARLSAADKPDWGEVTRLDLGQVTDRVSPNGNYFAFMSQRPLTGYDNHDSNPTSGGARAVEVYLYSRSTAALTCVSCDPNDVPPRGVLDSEQSGEGIGLLVDRPEEWTGHWLAGSIPGWTKSSGQQATYQSRYLSDTGRLFFDSPEPLVPAAENGKNDVYEYELAGEGTCESTRGCVALISSGASSQESAFLDASASGNEVFFLTASPLVASDHDTNFDVYDARVCSEASPCVQASAGAKAPCESEAGCKGPSATAPVFSSPASLSATGTGNLTPPLAEPIKQPANKAPPAGVTRTQRLAKALKACRKLKRKGKRVACEKVARRKYAAKKAGRSTTKRHA